MKITPEEILATAARLIAEQGFDRTTIADIAAGARISNGTVLYHFKTKERLLAELARRHLMRLQRRCQDAGEGRGTGLGLVEAFMAAVFEHLRVDPHGWKIFFNEIGTRRLSAHGKLQEQFDAVCRFPVILLERLIMAGQGDGSIAPCDPGEAASAVWAVFVGSAWSVLFQNGNQSAMAHGGTQCVLRMLSGQRLNQQATMYPQRGTMCSAP